MPGFLFSEQELGYVSWHIAVMINMDMPLLLCSTGMCMSFFVLVSSQTEHKQLGLLGPLHVRCLCRYSTKY